MKAMVLVTVFLVVGLFGTAYAQTNTTRSYGVLFDNTGSMRTFIPRLQEIAKAVVRKADGSSPVSIFGFVTTSTSPPLSSVATGLECSLDSVQLEKQIGQIGAVGGQTTLIDAIRSASERMKNPVSPGCGKPDEQILFVLSDGEDRASSTTNDDLFKVLKETGVKAYVVALLGDDSGFIGKSPRQKSKEFLQKLALESGGRIVFPKKRETAQEVLERLFDPNYSFQK